MALLSPQVLPISPPPSSSSAAAAFFPTRPSRQSARWPSSPRRSDGHLSLTVPGEKAARRPLPVVRASPSSLGCTGPGSEVLGDVAIYSSLTGEPVLFRDLWDQNEGMAVVALLRHFGCFCCWELASVLRDAKSRFDSAGVKLIAVGVGSPDKARILSERLPFPLDCLYADPDRKAYDALGLYYGLGRTFFNPASAKVFSRFESLQKAMKNYTIAATPDDKSSVLQQVEVRRAIPRGAQHHNPHHQCYNDYQHQNRGLNKSSGRSVDGSQTTAKKIFVGGLSANLTQEEFKRYFEKFGKITDVVVMYDSATNRPRGFGFITFDAEESVENAVKNAFHTLNGKTVEVKRAVPREGGDNTNSYNKNNDNGNSNPRMGNGKGSNLNCYPGGIYPPYSPRFGAFQGYGTHPYAPYTYGGSYGGGYAFGGPGISYGAPYATSWNTWNGRGFVDIRQSPVPYGAIGFYPGCYNGSINPYVGMGVGGYHGQANGKWHQDDDDSQAHAVNATTPTQAEDNDF